MQNKIIYVCQLPAWDRLQIYKRIKKTLVASGVYSPENVREIMAGKIVDLDFMK